MWCSELRPKGSRNQWDTQCRPGCRFAACMFQERMRRILVHRGQCIQARRCSWTCSWTKAVTRSLEGTCLARQSNTTCLMHTASRLHWQRPGNPCRSSRPWSSCFAQWIQRWQHMPAWTCPLCRSSLRCTVHRLHLIRRTRRCTHTTKHRRILLLSMNSRDMSSSCR